MVMFDGLKKIRLWVRWMMWSPREKYTYLWVRSGSYH